MFSLLLYICQLATALLATIELIIKSLIGK